jgi:hypothetical protein
LPQPTRCGRRRLKRAAAVVGHRGSAGTLHIAQVSQLQIDALEMTTKENSMTKDLKTGDEVKWKTPQGETTGTVEKKLTEPTAIKGHRVAASKDNPEYLVKSSKSGKEAAHKPDALTKVGKPHKNE